MALNIQRVEQGAALHVIRYDYDHAADGVPALDRVTVDVRLPGGWALAGGYRPDGDLDVSHEVSGDVQSLTIRDVPLYCVVLLEPVDQS
jgi:hypothetical protein